MTNKQYAQQFQLLANLMELHGESSYRIKSYANAYRIIRAIPEPVQEMSLAQVKEVKGIGDAIGHKIQELRLNGKIEMLDEYTAKTPIGVVHLMQIKGLGVKKIKLLWEEMDITSPGELLYACNENRLITIKGFGAKTQANIQKQLEYFFQSRNKLHYATVENEAENLVLDIQEVLGDTQVSLTGDVRRLMPEIEAIDLLVGQADMSAVFEADLLELVSHDADSAVYRCKTIDQGFAVILYTCPADFFGYNLLRTTGNEKFVQQFFELQFPNPIDWKHVNPAAFVGLDEAAIFELAKVPFIAAELRDIPKIIFKAQANPLPALLEVADIKGVIHAHSTWSDGSQSIEQMALHCQEKGYEYLGLTDHSKAAFYANGLSEERVLEQWKEIEILNEKLAPFKILKGIEADILYDGDLDYTPELLAGFDFVIASVHSNIRMNEEKATQRLLAAIQNPYTTILGHPTGRLLLSREGYPIDHKAVIDACAKHNVIIELNANPLRLDIDYTWIPYALEQGVKIAVNPDAHSTKGVEDIHFGVLAARKGNLTAKDCINTLDLEQIEQLFAAKNKK